MKPGVKAPPSGGDEGSPFDSVFGRIFTGEIPADKLFEDEHVRSPWTMK
jgi:hypothetical protein